MLMILLGYVGHEKGCLELEAAAMAGALLGFLYYNLPPARIYLGDGGAYFLGFQIGLFALLNSHKGEIFAALVAPTFVLALPIVDATLAIVRRGLRGLPILRADRRHLHHHLLRCGFSQARVVLLCYAMTLVFLVLGMAVHWSRGELIPALFVVWIVLLLLCAGACRFSRKWFAVRQVVAQSLGMRAEVGYALCLCRLLELEGKRRSSAAELWPELVRTAERLGFVAVRLTHLDKSYFWQRPHVTEPLDTVHHETDWGWGGRLELSAPNGSGAPVPDPRESNGWVSRQPVLADGGSARFEIKSELLAEAWLKATRSYHHESPRLPPLELPHRVRRRPLESPGARLVLRRPPAAANNGL